MPAAKHPRHSLLLLAAAEAGLAVPAALIAWLFGLPLAERLLGGDSPALVLARGVAATLPLLAVLWLMLRSRHEVLVRFRRRVEDLLGDLLGDARPAMLLLVAVAAGLGEEVLFRGALQPLAGGWLTPLLGEAAPWGGVVVGALLFGLAHPISPLYVVLATLVGLYFGALVQLSGEFGSVIVAHALYDVVALGWLMGAPTADESP